MEKFKKLMKLTLVTIFFSLVYSPLNAGCVICDGSGNNDGYCIGDQVKACVDEGTIFDARCKTGISTTKDCPSIG